MQMKGYDHIYVVSFFNIRVQKWKKRISVVKKLIFVFGYFKNRVQKCSKVKGEYIDAQQRLPW